MKTVLTTPDADPLREAQAAPEAQESPPPAETGLTPTSPLPANTPTRGGARVKVPKEVRDAIVVKVMEEMGQGVSLRELSAEHGISYETVRMWLLSDVPDQYKALQQQGLIARIVDCDTELDNSTDHIEVNKNAHAARFSRWDAERRLPRLFGPKQEISGPDGGPVQVQHSTLETARRLAYLTEVARRDAIDVTPLPDPQPDVALNPLFPRSTST